LLYPSRAEQDPQRVHGLALEVLGEMAASGPPVDGIGLTGRMHGLLCVDAVSEALTRFISWQDR
jgi:sugar (pentulose or hexulose) kinase